MEAHGTLWRSWPQEMGRRNPCFNAVELRAPMACPISEKKTRSGHNRELAPVFFAVARKRSHGDRGPASHFIWGTTAGGWETLLFWCDLNFGRGTDHFRGVGDPCRAGITVLKKEAGAIRGRRGSCCVSGPEIPAPAAKISAPAGRTRKRAEMQLPPWHRPLFRHPARFNFRGSFDCLVPPWGSLETRWPCVPSRTSGLAPQQIRSAPK